MPSSALNPFVRLVTVSPPGCAVENLTDDNLEAVRQADELEGQLMDEMEDRESDVSPWGILNRLSPLLFAWVSNQLIMLNDWSGRIQGTEDWKPVTSQRGCARSATAPASVLSATCMLTCSGWRGGVEGGWGAGGRCIATGASAEVNHALSQHHTC